MEDAFIGEIRPFAFGFVPYGWLACNGATYPIQQFTPLYSIIGTQYGGTATTFNVPNLQGTVMVGTKNGDPNFGQVGEAGGTESVTLITSEMPQHNHNVQTFSRTVVSESSLMVNQPGNTVYLTGADSTIPNPDKTIYAYSTSTPTALLNQNTIGPSPSSPATPHENRTPFVALTYCICANGIFPTRP